MSAAVIAFALLDLAALAFLFWQFRRLGRQAHELSQVAQRLLPADGAAPDLDSLLRGCAPQVIAIEILNPMELAAKQSWFAHAFGSLAPPLIRRIVYERTLEILQRQLREFGVEAEVSLHRAGRERA